MLPRGEGSNRIQRFQSPGTRNPAKWMLRGLASAWCGRPSLSATGVCCVGGAPDLPAQNGLNPVGKIPPRHEPGACTLSKECRQCKMLRERDSPEKADAKGVCGPPPSAFSSRSLCPRDTLRFADLSGFEIWGGGTVGGRIPHLNAHERPRPRLRTPSPELPVRFHTPGNSWMPHLTSTPPMILSPGKHNLRISTYRGLGCALKGWRTLPSVLLISSRRTYPPRKPPTVYY